MCEFCQLRFDADELDIIATMYQLAADDAEACCGGITAENAGAISYYTRKAHQHKEQAKALRGFYAAGVKAGTFGHA